MAGIYYLSTMKRITSLLFFLLISFEGSARMCYDTPPPKLHSIFDAPQPKPSFVMEGRATWSSRPSYSPVRDDGDKVVEGITFLVFGAICYGVAGYFAYKANKAEQTSPSTNGHYYADGTSILLSGLFIVLGSGFLVPGLILTIKYSSNSGRKWY